MNKLLKSLTALYLMLSTAPAFAQSGSAAYFTDNYLHRFQLNPAIANERDFVGCPILGSISLGLGGSLHLKDLVYDFKGMKVIFTDSNIPVQQVAQHVRASNKLTVQLSDNLLEAGFKIAGGYSAVTLSAHARGAANIPGSLMFMLKEPDKHSEFHIDPMRIKASAYFQLALNHSHDISIIPGLRLGATLKLLAGLGSADARFENTSLRRSTQNNIWEISSLAQIEASAPGLEYRVEYNPIDNRYIVTDLDLTRHQLDGWGAAIDLGLTYTRSAFEFSLAFLDIGGMTWRNNIMASTIGRHNFRTPTDSFNIPDGEWKIAMKHIRLAIGNLYQMQDIGNAGPRLTSLAPIINAGVRYKASFYTPLTFGLLSTTRIDGPFTTADLRLSANIRPVSVIAASASIVGGTEGFGLGWIISINCPGIALYAGMDRTPYSLGRYGLPMNSAMTFNAGFDIPLN
ncbi:MAG: hypothetical protein K2H47_11160 [Muribaculaceae bacterium]|nr:hypothetical protein [Muribaculaceae bacterium]